MKKTDLQSGMIIETRYGKQGLVILNSCYNGVDVIVFSDNDWTNLDGFSNDLLWSVEEDGSQSDYAMTIDIVKVYRPDLPSGFLGRDNKFSHFTPIWERPKNIPEYTVEELTNMIGHDFKIKK